MDFALYPAMDPMLDRTLLDWWWVQSLNFRGILGWLTVLQAGVTNHEVRVPLIDAIVRMIVAHSDSVALLKAVLEVRAQAGPAGH